MRTVSLYIGSIDKRSVTWLGMRSLLGLLSRFSGCSPYDYASACVDNTSVSNGPFISHILLGRRKKINRAEGNYEIVYFL